MYTISLSNPLAPKTSTASETQVNSALLYQALSPWVWNIFQNDRQLHTTFLLSSDSVQNQSGERVLRHRRWGHHTWRALPRLLLHSQPLHAHQGGQEQVSVTVSKDVVRYPQLTHGQMTCCIELSVTISTIVQSCLILFCISCLCFQFNILPFYISMYGNVSLCLSVCQGIDRAALQETAVGAGERLHREKFLERDRR